MLCNCFQFADSSKYSSFYYICFFFFFSVKLIFESLPNGAMRIFGEHTDLHLCFNHRGKLIARVSKHVHPPEMLLYDDYSHEK